MKRLSLAVAVLLAAACGNDATSIQMFKAAPSTIALGQTTELVFAADPGATLTIDQGVGDVTGKTSVTVSPTESTSYTLTAKKGSAQVAAFANVTVTRAASAAFKLVRASSADAVAGAPESFTVSALDGSGNVNGSYRGTVHFSSDDAQATVPADVTFNAGNAGVVTVSGTFRTAGTHVFVAVDAAVATAQGVARVPVGPAAAARLALAGTPDAQSAGDAVVVAVTAFDPFGNVATGYSGTVHFSSDDATAQLPADFTFAGAATAGTHPFKAVFTTAGVASLTVADTGTGVTAATGSLTVHHAAPSQVAMSGMPAQVTAGATETIVIAVRDGFGNLANDYAGTLHFVNTDPAAPAIADMTLTAADGGTVSVDVTFVTAGDQSVIAVDTVNSSLAGSTSAKVNHGAASAYVLSTLPTSAIAGEPLPLTITAVDAHGNPVKDYAGTAHVSSADPTDRLPPDGTFVNGVRTVSLAFVRAATLPHTATVGELGGTLKADTTGVTIVAGDASGLLVSSGAPVAGTAATVTVTAQDDFANTAATYAGTVTLSSTDAFATLPTPYTFVTADAGQHGFQVTLKTAGSQAVTASDGTLSGGGLYTVSPGNAANCDLTVIAKAGTQVGFRVKLFDPFSNQATGYRGTVTLSSSDSVATLPAPTTYSATDAGEHDFIAQLPTPGDQSITATDAANGLSCKASVSIVTAQFFALTVSGGEAWAGAPVQVTLQAQDGTGTPITNYAGTIQFASSDTAATLPANVTLTGTEGGTATVKVTFSSIGLQSFTASDVADPAKTGTVFQIVHGLIYTDPASGGKVRVIRDAAASNTSVVQLDVVSNTSLFPLTAGSPDTVRNGVFAAGMNLPLDTTKVGADTTLLVTTAPAGSTGPLVLGAAPQAVGAAFNNGVLYSGVSQKRVDGSTIRGDVAVRPFPGASSFYYSLRLKLTPGATPGTVFDGQGLGAKFHAAVRDRSGSDVFSNADFAIGKLEVR